MRGMAAIGSEGRRGQVCNKVVVKVPPLRDVRRHRVRRADLVEDGAQGTVNAVRPAGVSHRRRARSDERVVQRCTALQARKDRKDYGMTNELTTKRKCC